MNLRCIFNAKSAIGHRKLAILINNECFGVWPRHGYFNSFLKEDYYVQENDLFGFFCFGAGPGSDEHS